MSGDGRAPARRARRHRRPQGLLRGGPGPAHRAVQRVDPRRPARARAGRDAGRPRDRHPHARRRGGGRAGPAHPSRAGGAGFRRGRGAQRGLRHHPHRRHRHHRPLAGPRRCSNAMASSYPRVQIVVVDATTTSLLPQVAQRPPRPRRHRPASSGPGRGDRAALRRGPARRRAQSATRSLRETASRSPRSPSTTSCSSRKGTAFRDDLDRQARRRRRHAAHAGRARRHAARRLAGLRRLRPGDAPGVGRVRPVRRRMGPGEHRRRHAAHGGAGVAAPRPPVGRDAERSRDVLARQVVAEQADRQPTPACTPSVNDRSTSRCAPAPPDRWPPRSETIDGRPRRRRPLRPRRPPGRDHAARRRDARDRGPHRQRRAAPARRASWRRAVPTSAKASRPRTAGARAAAAITACSGSVPILFGVTGPAVSGPALLLGLGRPGRDEPGRLRVRERAEHGPPVHGRSM